MDLISHLSVVCAMPNSLSIARLALNCVWTLLGVLAAKEREELIRPSLPALARICRAFPPLMEDTVQLLVQVTFDWVIIMDLTPPTLGCEDVVVLSQCVRLLSSQTLYNWNSSYFQTGALSQICLDINIFAFTTNHLNAQDVREVVGDLPGESSLAEEIVATFETILGETVFAKRVF